MRLMIIADDLSGAADCAIAFASLGLDTVVTLDPSHDTGAAQVIAIDTDTRRLSSSEAAARTVAAYQKSKAGQRLYKKIDSTLRGNWAAEVAALQALAGLAIVAPAFPATGRTTHEGQVLVHGQPLETTETWKLEHADQCADLNIMLETAGLRTAKLTLETLRGDAFVLTEHIKQIAKGDSQALIVDAETSEDLRRLAQVTAKMSEGLFWVGSGGLAREIAGLPDLFDSPSQDVSFMQRKLAPILVLVGSLSDVSDRQCIMLKERAGIQELTIMPGVLRKGPAYAAWSEWERRIGACLKRGEDLLLRIGRDETFDPAEGALLSASLAAMIRPHFDKVGGLIATGGETARAMLGAVGIGSLKLQCEVEAGVAFGRPIASRDGYRPGVITKAGAFGTDHALYASWLHLSNITEPANVAEGSVHFPAKQGKKS
ncbi:four-carbon acid sugar kinase family protein [Pseudomonas sp. LTJR-52]|uniref:four-carbon acid sugar kinase family protein n=1 Tax=Pseudomonas sp. LTJR-52 TaxID=2479392 RepID=UPI000EFD8CD2|nr:four-carbon acid sugar kinase family protein [Pseudomonas sp. LTJR-52]AYN96650.1 four-carbon acid sugar kinase family protein [Pseudomonas sp. LTJR-52]